AAALAGVALLTGAGQPLRAAERPAGLDQVQQIVVIYMENRAFDTLYGLFPGAEGIANAGATATQTDKDGKPYATLPPVMDTEHKPAIVDPRFPKDLPNKPFLIDPYVPTNQKTGDLVHRYYQQLQQINGGKMDRFAAESDAGGLVMGYYDGRPMQLWKYAQKYTLADHFFQAAIGGSFLNHQWLICACTPHNPNAPADLWAQLDANGRMVKDGAYTPDGYAVNTIMPAYTPYRKTASDPARRLQPVTLPTIGDRLSEKGIPWVWYSGGWDDAVAGKPGPLFQYHHQAFAYYERYGDNTPGRAQHLKDWKDFSAAIDAGKIPAVVFYKPYGDENQHPGYAEVDSGDRHVADILRRIEAGPQWKSTVVIITYDENGGSWDHVPPPIADRWGPSTRVPALIISPFAKKGHVDHTHYDTTSILAFIELRHGLKPLTDRDAKANPLLGALHFTK
ncbi:MAG TPA: alkaline phosphatase family protein, partial [bacterium]